MDASPKSTRRSPTWLPEINAAVADVASFDAELGPAPVDARGPGPVS